MTETKAVTDMLTQQAQSRCEDQLGTGWVVAKIVEEPVFVNKELRSVSVTVFGKHGEREARHCATMRITHTDLKKSHNKRKPQ